MENNVVDVTLYVDGQSDGLYRGIVWDLSSGNVLTTVFLSPGTSQVSIPAGNVALVVHSFGCEATYVTEESSYGSIMATTGVSDFVTCSLWSSVLSDGFLLPESERALLGGQLPRWQPDRMWAAAFTGVVPHRTEGEVLEMDIAVKPLFEERMVFLRDVVGLEYVASAEAFVTGCVAGRHLADGSPVGMCSICIPLYRYEGDLVASFVRFGEDSVSGVPRRLIAVITDIGGRRFLKSYDLSGAFEGQVSYDISSELSFEEPPVPEGGGLQPMLLDWNEVVTNVAL